MKKGTAVKKPVWSKPQPKPKPHPKDRSFPPPTPGRRIQQDDADAQIQTPAFARVSSDGNAICAASPCPMYRILLGLQLQS